MRFTQFLRARSKPTRVLFAVLLVILLAIGIYYLPPVHSRLAWRIEALRAQVVYSLNPPDEAVFQPTEQAMLETIVAQTMQAFQLATPLPSPTAAVTPRPGPTIPPTPSPTALPGSVVLQGVKYEDQHNRWNYCGPANFSMALRFWGWGGNRDVIGQAVLPSNTDKNGKPVNKDKNVMPYEFQDFIAQNVPGMSSLIRYGGDIDVIRRLLAAGFPVVAEKGYFEVDGNGNYSWMGHYQFVTGYDDGKGELIVQDTYYDGANFHISYDKFTEGWRSFNYIFVVVYPYDREAQVLTALGDWADGGWATRHALDLAENESGILAGLDQYFAWFNRGTSQVELQEYADAASAYDYAFNLYANLGGEKFSRPYRMMWYQTGPYKAYFYSGRYMDVINLANTTLNDTISQPVLEESLYWRGKAETMIGQINFAIQDFRAALVVHPNWEPAVQALQDLGVQP